MKVNHSFPIFIDSNSKILILGSFPSVKSREEDFYYMHKQNEFSLLVEEGDTVPVSFIEEEERDA